MAIVLINHLITVTKACLMNLVEGSVMSKVNYALYLFMYCVSASCITMDK